MNLCDLQHMQFVQTQELKQFHRKIMNFAAILLLIFLVITLCSRLKK